MHELKVDLHLTADEAARGAEREVLATVVRRNDGAQVAAPEALRVQTPPGVADETKLRLPGAGHMLADGTQGDVVVTVRVAQRNVSCELVLGTEDLERGCSTEVSLSPSRQLVVDVPAGSTDGTMLLLRGSGQRQPDGTLGDLFVTLRHDARLGRRPRPARAKQGFRREKLVDLFVLLLGLFGFIGGFAFPLSEVGNPVVFIDGRFFVLGFLAIGVLVLLNVPSAIGPLHGRRRVLAIVAAIAALAGVVGLTIALLRVLEGFGYHLKL